MAVVSHHSVQDHPRVCGKNSYYSLVCDSTIGSPPRVREKPALRSASQSKPGITPACAGKTPPYGFVGTVTRDHPRVCGKNRVFNNCVFVVMGSPPRVREKPVTKAKQYASTGITPACAGKTISSKLAKSWSWDHPRVCGKNWESDPNNRRGTGSPPRVREKLPYNL